jgi:hypothetical protein
LNSSPDPEKIKTDHCQDERAARGSEKRTHPRRPVAIPVMCDILGIDGKAKDIHMGAIKEVSRAGLTIELYSDPIYGEVALSFLNDENRDVRIKAKVVHSNVQDALKSRAGLLVLGPKIEVNNFFSQVMKTKGISAQGCQ